MTEPIQSSPERQESHQAGGREAADLALSAASQRYQIRQEIGRGFSSIVYEAQDTLRGRTVALKVLSLGESLSEERRQDMAERFLREARAISALSHPNIVSIYEVGQTGDGRHFIAMELLSGESLRTRMDREAPLGADDAVPIALQTADALEYAHVRGIVHRDVKPDNIFVLPDGRVKLMDFGVAHIVSEGTLTQTGTVVGSPAYMSPEQISGLPLTGASDVFSLGVTLAEMLTGHKPFDAPSIPAVMNRILHRPPQIDGVQPRALRKALAQALAKTQTARYPSAQAFAESLRRLVMPGQTGSSTDTVVMAAPLPRPRPAAPAAPAPLAAEMPQEPPSRAALWTFGLAGLALLAAAPFAVGHLSLTPSASASMRGLTSPVQRVSQSVSGLPIAHIPTTWGRARAAHPVPPVRLAKQRARPMPAAPAVARTVTLAAPAAARPVKQVLSVGAHTVDDTTPAAGHAPKPMTRTFAAPPKPAPKLATPVLAAKIVPAHAARPVLVPRPAPLLVAKAMPARPAHTPRTRIAMALPAASLLARRQAAAHPAVVRVDSSRQEQHFSPPAPAFHAAPVYAAPAPRPFVIPDSAPHILRRPAAAYPDTLRAAGIGGSVLVRLSVSAQGNVTEATVLQSSGTDDLDAAALDAVGHWFYEPAYQNGRAMPSEVTARVDFRP